MPVHEGSVLCMRCWATVSLRVSGPSEDPLGELLGTPCFARTVLLDLADTQEIDTSGVVWLARTSDAFHQHQGKLIMHSVPAVVRRTLDVLHITSSLCIVHDEAEALHLIQQGSLSSK